MPKAYCKSTACLSPVVVCGSVDVVKGCTNVFINVHGCPGSATFLLVVCILGL